MSIEDRRREATDRDDLVQAVRRHSAEVAAHLDRVAGRLRAYPAGGRVEPAAAHWPAAVEAPPARSVVEELSALLLAERSLDTLLDAVLDLVRRTVDGCDGASLTLLEAGHPATAAATDERVVASDRCQYQLAEGPCLQAATTGEAVLAPSLPDPRWPRFAGCAHDHGWHSVLSMPLATAAGVAGGLNLYGSRPGAFDRADLGPARALADHAAVALMRVRDAREQQAVAATVQAFLLPATLPEVPGLALTASYLPASTGINIGGDWYDVLLLPRGQVVLVIGDVAGHGLDASMTMGELRTAVRAYALEHSDPAQVLALTADYLVRLEPEGYATCCLVLLDPGSGEAVWCSAGHPAPVVLAPGLPARPLVGGRGHGAVPPLGAPLPAPIDPPIDALIDPSIDAPGGGRLTLPARSRLLLFTDGLVERRGEDPDASLGRLLGVATASRHAPLDAWCHHVVESLLDGREVDDDVAVLAVEVAPRVTS
jgi:hypothetical protein